MNTTQRVTIYSPTSFKCAVNIPRILFQTQPLHDFEKGTRQLVTHSKSTSFARNASLCTMDGAVHPTRYPIRRHHRGAGTRGKVAMMLSVWWERDVLLRVAREPLPLTFYRPAPLRVRAGAKRAGRYAVHIPSTWSRKDVCITSGGRPC